MLSLAEGACVELVLGSEGSDSYSTDAPSKGQRSFPSLWMHALDSRFPVERFVILTAATTLRIPQSGGGRSTRSEPLQQLGGV